MPREVTEFHNIMPISNIPSVMVNGILSHERAANLPHSDVSMAGVQDRRDKKQVPHGLCLHQYANLYFDARNPMMYKRQAQVEGLCVLSVSTQVLQLPGVVVTDQNAASDYVRFYTPAWIPNLDLERIYADDWTHPGDQIAYWQHKSAKCAEVLVPHQVVMEYIQKAYVVSDAAEKKLQAMGFKRPIEFMPRLFFR